MNDPGPSSLPSLPSQPAASYATDDDPFVSPTQMDMFLVSTATSDYGVHEPPTRERFHSISHLLRAP